MDKEAIKKALEEATPGPWKVDHWPRTDELGIQQEGKIWEYVSLLSRRNDNKHEDAHLIVNAPTWLRELLEENERLQAERDIWAKRAEDLIKDDYTFMHRAKNAEAERDAYREALEWYAGHRFDDGQRARQALGKEQTP